MKTNPPSHDATMTLLGSVMENYSYQDFLKILRDPEKLQTWVEQGIKPDSDQILDPEDPTVGELATLSADAEQKAMELWSELKPEDRDRIKAVFLELWGREGTATLPISMND